MSKFTKMFLIMMLSSGCADYSDDCATGPYWPGYAPDDDDDSAGDDDDSAAGDDDDSATGDDDDSAPIEDVINDGFVGESLDPFMGFIQTETYTRQCDSVSPEFVELEMNNLVTVNVATRHNDESGLGTSLWAHPLPFQAVTEAAPGRFVLRLDCWPNNDVEQMLIVQYLVR